MRMLILPFVAALSACASSDYVRFTNELREDTQLSDKELQQLQYYVCPTFAIEREVKTADKAITNGRLVRKQGKLTDEVVIPKWTPGVGVGSTNRSVAVSFGEGANFDFGIHKGNSRGDYRPLGRNRDGEFEVRYDGQWYRMENNADYCGGTRFTQARLWIDQDSLEEVGKQRTVLKGRRVSPGRRVAGPSPEKAVKEPTPERVPKGPSPKKAAKGPSPEDAVKAPTSEKAVNGPKSEPSELARLSEPEPTAALSQETRVFIHYSTLEPSNEGIAKGLAQHLREQGFTVADVRAVDSAIDSGKVRYFFVQDKKISERLLAAAQRFLPGSRRGAAWDLKDLTDHAARPSGDNIEVWIPNRRPSVSVNR